MSAIGAVGYAGNVTAGGTTGQALVKSSAADFDAAWAAPSALGSGNPIYVSSNYYSNSMQANALTATTAITAGTSYYSPCWISQAISIADIQIYCNSATATNTLTVGVMTANAVTAAPSVTLNSATVTITNSGNAFVSFPVTASLPVGWVWFFAQANGGTVNTLNPVATTASFRAPSYIGTTATNANNWGYTSTTANVWQSPDPVLTPVASTTAAALHVFYRVA